MPKTGFASPTVNDSPEYIEKYIQYKLDKMTTHLTQMKKLHKHIEKARKIFETIQEDRNGN